MLTLACEKKTVNKVFLNKYMNIQSSLKDMVHCELCVQLGSQIEMNRLIERDEHECKNGRYTIDDHHLQIRDALTAEHTDLNPIKNPLIPSIGIIQIPSNIPVFLP